VQGAAFPLPAAHHCRLPAAMKAGMDGSVADHHAGVSVYIIIRSLQLPGNRAAQLNAGTLSQGTDCRWPGAGKERGGASGEHLLRNDLPCPVESPHVSNTMGEKSTPIRPQGLALSRHFCSPLSFRKVAALPRRGPPATGSGSTIFNFTMRSRLPSHTFSKMSAGRRPFPAISSSR